MQNKSECRSFAWSIGKNEFLEYGMIISVQFENPASDQKMTARALIDTGSNRTGIDLSLACKLRLEESSGTVVDRFDGSPRYRVFEGSLLIPEISLETRGRFLGLSIEGVDAVVGRDVLSFCELSFNALNGKAMLRRTT